MANTQFNTQVNTQTGKKNTLGQATAPVVTKYPGSPQLAKSATPVNFGRTAGGLGLSNLFDAAKKNLQVKSFTDAYQKAVPQQTQVTPVQTPQRDIGTEMRAAMQLPRTVENVNRVKTLMSERDAKVAANPALAQYANDDLQQMANLYTSTPGYRDDIDYAAQIQQLAAMPVTAENQQLMRDYLSARNAKIAAGGENMAQYANDNITAMANEYLSRYAPDTTDSSSYYDEAKRLAEQGYLDAEKSLQAQKDAQIAAMQKTYEDARRQADLAYAMNSRNTENILAEQGIGRGLGAAPSSGYSETARLGALANYANSVNDIYKQKVADENNLAAQFEAQRMQAMMNKYNSLMENQYARAEQGNFDRQQGFNEWSQSETLKNDTLATRQSIEASKAEVQALVNDELRKIQSFPAELRAQELANIAQEIANKYAGQYSEAEIANIIANTAKANASASGGYVDVDVDDIYKEIDELFANDKSTQPVFTNPQGWFSTFGR